MKLIVITPERETAGELNDVCRMLEAGIDRVHVRKPGLNEERMKNYLLRIPSELRSRISLHDHFSIAGEIGVGGVHLNSRNSILPSGFKGVVSRSAHSFAEIEADRSSDYIFLSPIFDSISKTGYAGRFGDKELLAAAGKGIVNGRIIALGGMNVDRFCNIARLGFGGAAFLGCIWSGHTSAERSRVVEDLIRIKERWNDCNL